MTTIIGNPKTLEKLLDTWPIGQELSGSELYRYTLEMLNVDLVGVYIGGRCIDLIDKLGQSEKIKLRKGTSESDLGHALQAYFKVTRKPGILIVTSGPGGTNSATPVKDAQSDSDALIVTVGQVPNESIEVGDEPFQGAVMVEPFSYWSKWSYRIKNVDELQSVLKTAYCLAIGSRPGPVVIELPSPVAQFQKTKLKSLDEVPLMDVSLKKPEVYRRVKVKTTNLDALTESLIASQRPVVIAGGGVYNAGATSDLMTLAERGDLPIMTTLMLLGSVGRHRLNFGLPGMHGHAGNNLATYNSDLVFYLGGRLDDRIIGDPEKFAPHAQIIWNDLNYPGINPKMASRVNKLELDSGEVMSYLISNLPQLNHERWINQIYFWQEKYPLPTHVPREVIQTIRKFVSMYEPKEPYVTTGVGAHQMFLAEFWDFDPELGMKMLLTSGGLGTMGTGMPFAVGAGYGDPTRSVYVFNGDGSSIMDQRAKLMAWQLVREGKFPGIKEIIFRDDSLGMVDFWQTEFWDKRKTATSIEAPDEYFKNIGLASQFKYFVVDYRNGGGSNRDIIENFVKYRGNGLLEVRMLPHPVRPMVPASKSVPDMKLPNGMKLDPADLQVWKNW